MNQDKIYYDICWKLWLEERLSQITIKDVEELFNSSNIVNTEPLQFNSLNDSLKYLNTFAVSHYSTFWIIKFQYSQNYYHILELIDVAKLDMNKYLALL